MIESTCPHKWDFKMYGTCPMCLEDMQSRHSPNYITTEMLKRIKHLSYTVDLPSRYVRMMASELLSLRQQIAQVQAQQEPAQAVPVAYGIPNTMITGNKHALMQVELEIPSDDQYGGALWIPLYLHPAPLESKQAVPVAEVVWYDPRLTHPDSKRAPHKIIDASLTFFDEAPVGTKLYTAPPAISEQAQVVPVAWKHDCAALLTNDVELWVDHCPHCGKPRTTHPAPLDSDTSKMVLELCKMLIERAGPDSMITRHMAQVSEKICERLEAGE